MGNLCLDLNIKLWSISHKDGEKLLLQGEERRGEERRETSLEG
jgi:hypothetical protein